jgi:hypothetical protein
MYVKNVAPYFTVGLQDLTKVLAGIEREALRKRLRSKNASPGGFRVYTREL